MRKTSFVALLVVGAMLVPLAVFASHQFNDVPNSHTFHNAIDWMADNNITVGCNPPGNTNYCPDDNVTRGQMAAFMKRLAENNVVDAATLDGRDSTNYQGSVAGTLISNLTPAAGTPTVLATINGFAVPANGGALAASADVTAGATGPDIGVIWIEIDGSGACGGTAPDTLSAMVFAAEIANIGTSTSAAANAGSHRVDLCGASGGGAVEYALGALTVQWVETTQIGTTAGASSGRSVQEILDEWSSSTFGE